MISPSPNEDVRSFTIFTLLNDARMRMHGRRRILLIILGNPVVKRTTSGAEQGWRRRAHVTLGFFRSSVPIFSFPQTVIPTDELDRSEFKSIQMFHCWKSQKITRVLFVLPSTSTLLLEPMLSNPFVKNSCFDINYE